MFDPSHSLDCAPTVRPYTPQDWGSVVTALAELLRGSYPNGHLWLSRRLTDIEEGRARCHVATSAGAELVGVAIETPKGAGSVKLSTVWVDVRYRRAGTGAQLLSACQDGWLAGAIGRAWVTANGDAVSAVSALVTPRGFRVAGCARDRYGPGRHEWVLVWTPEHHYADLRQQPKSYSQRSRPKRAWRPRTGPGEDPPRPAGSTVARAARRGL